MLPLVAPPPVMSWGAATHRVVAIVLPPMAPPRGHGCCGMVVPRGAVSLSSCHSLHRHDHAATCYVTGRCYVSCRRSCAATCGPPCCCSRCGMVVPQGTAVCRVTVILPLVALL